MTTQPSPVDGEADLRTLEAFVNNPSGSVTSRLGETYPVLNQRGADAQATVEAKFEPESFATEAALLADTALPNGSYAVSEDTKKVFVKDNAGAWKETVFVFDDNAELEAIVDAIDESITTDFVDTGATLVENTGYWPWTGDTFVDNTGYGTLTYDIQPGDVSFRATFTSGGGATSPITFFDANGSITGKQLQGDGQTSTNLAIQALPANTTRIVLSPIDSQPARLDVKRRANINQIETRTQGVITLPNRAGLASLSLTSPPVAEVYAHTAQGDGGDARYIYGGGVLPINGWGIDPKTVKGRAAYGYTNTVAIENEADLMDDLRAKPAYEIGYEEIDGIAYSGSGLSTVSKEAFGTTVRVSVGSGETHEIDVANIPMHRSIKFSIVAAGTGKVVFNPGIGRIFSTHSNEPFLEVTASGILEITRTNNSVYEADVYSGTVAGLDTYTPIQRARTGLVLGQSLGQQAYESEGYAYMRFVQEFEDLTSLTGVNIFNAAAGGSGISERDVNPSAPDNYWADSTNLSSLADGPLLTAFATEWAAMQAVIDAGEQPEPSFMLWKHGQQSSAFVTQAGDSTGAENPNFTQQNFIDITEYVISRIRAIVGNSTLPVFLEELAGRDAVLSEDRGGMKLIRAAQEQIIADDANIYAGAEMIGKPRRDTVHPAGWGYDQAGRDDARRVAKVIESVTSAPDHPEITAATYDSARKSVNFTVTAKNSGDRFWIPEHPWGFAVYDSSGNKLEIGDIVVDRISSNTLDYEVLLTGSNGTWPDATGGTLVYLDDYGADFTPRLDLPRIIRTRKANGSMELRSAVQTITAS